MNFELLKQLCAIRATSGDEGAMTSFILEYFADRGRFAHPFEVFAGPDFQDAVVVVFGKPRVAVFAHIDTIGYAAAYGNRLVKIGGPRAKSGSRLVGSDSQGSISCELVSAEDEDRKLELSYDFHRSIDRGTPLCYAQDWQETEEFVQSCYLDNRLGVFNALNLAEQANNVAIVFSTYEEHGGGTVQVAGRFLHEKYGLRQALISDISLESSGIELGKGVVISMRDRGIPRVSYVRRVIELARQHRIAHQLEVEDAGGSDGNILQASDVAWDWCFVGAAEANYHTPEEKAYKADIRAMLDLYKVLVAEL